MIKVTVENISDAQTLFNESISKGHEGIMIKKSKRTIYSWNTWQKKC